MTRGVKNPVESFYRRKKRIRRALAKAERRLLNGTPDPDKARQTYYDTIYANLGKFPRRN